MKNLKILLINLVIVFVVLGGISFYTEFQKKSNYKDSVKFFENTAHSVEKVVVSYMSSEQQLVNSWANAINGREQHMTIEEAILYTRTSLGEGQATVHIVWRDDLSNGFSTQANILEPDDYSVSYKQTIATHSYELSPYKVLQDYDFSTGGIQVTPSYTNPITGSKVIAFCSLITLLDNNTPREAIMLYVLPVSLLNNKWFFATEYLRCDIAIIEKNGNYIIQPATMKNTSFYEYMYSYNKYDPYDVKNLIFSNKTGTFMANDSRGTKNIFAYTIVEGTNNHAVILGMPEKNLERNTIDWIIILTTMLALMFSLISNTVFFNHLFKKQQEQVEIIRKQRLQLEEALFYAQKANVAKTTFLSNMSHDIRTPMNAIIGFTNLAITHIDNKNQTKDYLDKIHTSSNHLLSLINDILDMSRIESGKVELEETKENLMNIIDNLITIINPDIAEHQLALDIETDKIIHKTILCDKLRLNQIFLNLFSNAIKFTPSGGTVTLTVAEKSYYNGYANYEIHVIDTGIGMKADFAKKVFEPFERERNSTVSGIQGTGLGMAITKSLVDMMKGSISVESKEGAGTDFQVNLTFEVDTGDVKIVESANPEKKNNDFSGKTVLLVEDNELNQEIAAEILKGFGLEVLLANDGLDAINIIKKLETGSIDLILMDIQMPHLDGYETTKIIRRFDDSAKAKIPILAMTANAFEEDKRNAVAAGMNGHLSKPIDLTELTRELNNYLS